MFMSNPGKGGRGRNAPYTTTHYRIPTPIKETVEQLAAIYRIHAGREDENECKALIIRVQNAIANVENPPRKVAELENSLQRADKEIEALKIKTNNAIAKLETALNLKSREGTQKVLKESIRESIETLKQYLIPGI